MTTISSGSNESAHWIERDQQTVQHPGGGGGEHTIVLSHGKGMRVWDIDGREYLDAQGGAWMNKVGYGRRELADIGAAQMERLGHFAFGFDYTNTPSIELAEKLIARAPSNIAKVRFASSGGEADDHALQLARLYHHKKGHSGRRKILVHRGAYHGGTMAGVELTGGSPGSVGQSDDIIFLTAPRPYHSEFYNNRDMTEFCVEELKSNILEYGSDNIAAMFAELIVGPGGMIPLPDDYWPAMTSVLKENNILFVADEVVSAFGSAGAWFMSAEYGLTPDIIVLAKGISSGYMPMAALLLDSEIAETTDGLGPRNSYAGHAVGAAIASAHIDIIEREHLLENSIKRGRQFIRELTPLTKHPLVGDIRGRGLLIGIELVADKDSRTPLTDKAPELNGGLPRFLRKKHGILLSIRNSAILITPPLVINKDEVSRISEALIETLDQLDTGDFKLPEL